METNLIRAACLRPNSKGYWYCRQAVDELYFALLLFHIISILPQKKGYDKPFYSTFGQAPA